MFTYQSTSFSCAVFDTVTTIVTVTTHQLPSPFNKLEQYDFVVDITSVDPHPVPLSFSHKIINTSPIPVSLPGKFQGQRSLVGYIPRGRKESDTTEGTGTDSEGRK